MPQNAPKTPAPDHRRALLRLFREAGALQFGEFTLRSGRVSPYFFNSGRFQTGAQIERLGEFYGQAIARHAPQAEIVFGPAYKGVPLCVVSSIAFGRICGREIGYLYNRKEAKTHGDAGRFVGREPQPGQHLVLVDDTFTDGGTKYEAVELLRGAFDAPIDALVIAFHRMEADGTGEDAVARFEKVTGVPVVPLLSVADLEQALEDGSAAEGDLPAPPTDALAQIRAYRTRYGVQAGAAD